MQTNTSSKFSGKTLCIGEALIDMICTDYGKTLSEGNNFFLRNFNKIDNKNAKGTPHE